MKNYRELYNSVKTRLNPESFIFEQKFSDELGSISYSDVLSYVRLTMKGVEPAYTQRSKDAGERVKAHLNKELVNKTFRYQGSVMTNTHIKGYSDIDLLVISENFYSYDSTEVARILDHQNIKQRWKPSSISKLESERNVSSYTGNSLEDLKNLRLKSETILMDQYKICDISKPKSIKITNRHLNRDVDIVIANWYDDVRSIISGKGDNRGIQVYDKKLNTKGAKDFPFISINKINQKSTETSGRLKKIIRFLKNVKAHCGQELELSSFDINAICYDIDTSSYSNLKYHELVKVIYIQLFNLVNNEVKADDLVSVDKREYILRASPEKKRDLKIMLDEVLAIYTDLKEVTIL